MSVCVCAVTWQSSRIAPYWPPSAHPCNVEDPLIRNSALPVSGGRRLRNLGLPLFVALPGREPIRRWRPKHGDDSVCAGSWLARAGHRTQGTGHRASGRQQQPWAMGHGPWTVDGGLWWTVDYLWAVNCGLWALDRGPWEGSWAMDPGRAAHRHGMDDGAIMEQSQRARPSRQRARPRPGGRMGGRGRRGRRPRCASRRFVGTGLSCLLRANRSI